MCVRARALEAPACGGAACGAAGAALPARAVRLPLPHLTIVLPRAPGSLLAGSVGVAQRCVARRASPRAMGLFDKAKEAAIEAAAKAAEAAAGAAGFSKTDDDYISRFVDLEERKGTTQAEVGGNTGGKDSYSVTFLGSNGEAQVVECPADGYILDAAIEAEVDLPYTCKAGICGVCVGRVAEGSVDQSDIVDLSYCLEEEDIAKGCALLCMSRPTSDVTLETQCDWGYRLGMEEWKGATGNVGDAVAKEWESISESAAKAEKAEAESAKNL